MNMGRYDDDWGYPPYVSAAEKKARNAAAAKKLAAKNSNLKPVIASGNKIAKTFWGKAWCDNVESYQDYSNRLPRGRSYIGQGAVLDLQIMPGLVTALVAGSYGDPYTIKIEIKPLEKNRWENIKKRCTGQINSLLALAQGKLPAEILQSFCDRGEGLFPSPKEIKTKCSCPDWAGLCKHLAAVMYGIGVRLDEDPKLFFTLRGVDENELIGADIVDTLTEGVVPEIAAENLADVFGMEFDSLEDIKPDLKPVKAGVKPVTEKWTPGKIVAMRKKLGLTQAEFGKKLDTSGTSVCFWEKGKSPVPLRFIPKLDALEKPPPPPVKPPKATKPVKTAKPVKALKLTPVGIARLRRKLELSQTDFAKRLGVSAATIGNWEKGKSAPREELKQKIQKLSEF
jgi:uncharacterized Zn finger protein